MQTNKASLVSIACGLGFLVLSGCLDITTTNQVKSDGSIVRTITFTGDSAEVYGGNFPVQLDSSWNRSIAKTDDKTFALTATRTFRDAGEMNEALRGTFGKSLQYQIVFDKSFQWFFTVYRYEELNLPYVQFTSIPLSRYLSQAEVDWLKEKVLQDDSTNRTASREDSLTLGRLVPRAEEWASRNNFEAIFTAFLDGVKMLNDPSLTARAVESLKDTLYNRSAKSIDENKSDTLRIIFRSVLRSAATDKAWQANAAAFEDIKRRSEFERKTNSHKYVTHVVMPGLITSSNARKIEANTATWEDFKDVARYIGYTMTVESRQVNWWAVIVAVIVVLSLLSGLVFSALRRRVRG